MLVGVQIICLGLAAELLSRTYYESQGKPIYAVRKMRSHEPQAMPIVHRKVIRMAQGVPVEKTANDVGRLTGAEGRAIG